MKTTVNGIALHHEVEGEGPWVVLSHSLGCTLRMWDPQVRALTAAGYRVLRFDTRGHGASDVPPGPYTLNEMAEDLRALLEALGVTRPHFVGLSMGGMIGMTAALAYPDLFASLVLCDTTSRIPAEAGPVWDARIQMASTAGMEPLVEPTLKRWFTEPFLQSARPETDAVRAMLRGTVPAGYVGCCQAIARINLTERLGAISCPVHVIVGDQDAGTPVAMSEAIQAAIPGSTLSVLAQASHLSNLEQPAAFDADLLAFLARVQAP